MNEFDLVLANGAKLHAYDTGATGADQLTVVWHHGTTNIGTPPAPLFATSERLGIRWISYDRPGYGGSTAVLGQEFGAAPGRDIESAAGYGAAVADELGIDEFAVMGHSGGSPHALACGALLPDRVLAVVNVSGIAPIDANGLDWFAGMGPTSEATLRAALAGREAKERHEAATADSDDIDFIDADFIALQGKWSWFGQVVEPAMVNGRGPLIDDDLAYVTPWKFDPAQVTAPALFLHGESDRIIPCTHSEWLAQHCPSAELRIVHDAGHISVLTAADSALDWLRKQI